MKYDNNKFYKVTKKINNDNVSFVIQFTDDLKQSGIDSDEFRVELKNVFDSSIPWSNPEYDDGFQDHYFDNVDTAVFIRSGDGELIALSIAFKIEREDDYILYIAGIWVNDKYKKIGLGKILIEEIIFNSITDDSIDKYSNVFVSLRTQNPQLYYYLSTRFDVYPHRDKEITKEIADVGDYINQMFSPTKTYESDSLIVRNVFPKGIIVGSHHPSRDEEINNYVQGLLNIEEGDSFIMIIPFSNDENNTQQDVFDLLRYA